MKEISAFVIVCLCAYLCSANKQNNAEVAPTDSKYPAVQRDAAPEIEQQAVYPVEEAQEKVVYVDNSTVFTPLIDSIMKGDEKAAEELIRNGADINALDAYGRSPLYVSILHGLPHTSKMLIERGANLNSVAPEYGYTPLQLALLMSNDSKIAEVLIQNGADLSITSVDGMTPLHRSIQMGTTKLPEMMIKKGADVNAQDNEGNTPLHVSVLYGRDEMVALLVENGANVNIVESRYGYTPFHLSIIMQNGDKIVEFLMKHGANLSIRSKDGMTALHRSIQMGKKSIAEQLIKSGAIDLDAQDIEGRTPLYMTVVYGSDEIAKLLIEHGADVNIAEHTNGFTPLHLSVMMKDGIKITELLLDNNADLSALSKNGDKPETIAEYYGNEKIINLLKHKGDGENLISP